MGIQQELSDNIFAKGSLSRLEDNAGRLLVKNRKLFEQAEKWKQLYYGIKAKYEEMSGKAAVAECAMEEEKRVDSEMVQEVQV